MLCANVTVAANPRKITEMCFSTKRDVNRDKMSPQSVTELMRFNPMAAQTSRECVLCIDRQASNLYPARLTIKSK